jgi:hypothetical protein
MTGIGYRFCYLSCRYQPVPRPRSIQASFDSVSASLRRGDVKISSGFHRWPIAALRYAREQNGDISR